MWEKGWPGKKIARYYCMSPEGVYTVLRRYMKKENQKWVMSERMTNQSLEGKSAIVSQIIAQATEAKVVKLDEKV